MDIIAADSSGLKGWSEAFLRWFEGFWTRWTGEFSWAGDLQSVVAGIAALVMLGLCLYVCAALSLGVWELLKALFDVFIVILDWLFDELPRHCRTAKNTLSKRWTKRQLRRRASPDAVVNVQRPSRVTTRAPVFKASTGHPAQTWLRNPTSATTATGRATVGDSGVTLPPSTPTTPSPINRKSALVGKYGPPREGRSQQSRATAGTTNTPPFDELLAEARLFASQHPPKSSTEPAPILVDEDHEERAVGETPAETYDWKYWHLAKACVVLFREHAAYHVIEHNAAEPPMGALAVDYKGQVRGTYPFGDVVAGKPGWTTALPGSPARMEAYVTDDGWEVVANCITFDGNKVRLSSWRMSSTQQGKSNVSVGADGHEYGVTVEEAYLFLARFLQDQAHPRF